MPHRQHKAEEHRAGGSPAPAVPEPSLGSCGERSLRPSGDGMEGHLRDMSSSDCRPR